MKGEKLKLISTCIIVAFSVTILPGLCTPTSCGMFCRVYKPVPPPPSISALAVLCPVVPPVPTWVWILTRSCKQSPVACCLLEPKALSATSQQQQLSARLCFCKYKTENPCNYFWCPRSYAAWQSSLYTEQSVRPLMTNSPLHRRLCVSI